MNYLDYIIESSVEKPKFNDNFWKWFGNSKVVTEYFKPMVMYHGSENDFNEFKLELAGNNLAFGKGFYFSNSKSLGKIYAGEKGINYACYIKMENPYVAKSPNMSYNEGLERRRIFRNNPNVREDLLNQGYDGIMITEDDGYMEVVVFNSNQIKSINNNGEWNPNSNNINENNEYVVFNSNDIKTLNKKDSKIIENIENNSFKSWFNNSKVIDKNGNPLIVYHGTNSKFDNFKSEYINTRNHKEQFFGFWFTSNKSDAEQYGKNIIKCYLSIQKPATETNIVKYARAFNKKYKLGYESYECGLNLLETKHGRLFQNYLIKNEFDGIIFDNNYIVFEPNQIKIIETNNKITESKIQDKYKDQVQINGEWYHKRIIDNHFGEGFFNKIKIGDEIDWDNNEDNNKIKQQIDDNQLFSIAKNYFGLTNSIYNAGYILPDGSLLKFGENQKDYEHIEIETAFQEYDIDVSMYDFIDKGAIRIIPSSNSITLLISAEPTYQQRKIIIDLLNQGFKINIEYAKNAKDYLLGNKENLQYRSYNLDNSKKLEQDINSFFNNGKLSNEFFENFIIYKK